MMADQMNCFRCRRVLNVHGQFYLLSDIDEELRSVIVRGLNELELGQEHVCEKCFTQAMQHLNESNQDVDEPNQDVDEPNQDVDESNQDVDEPNQVVNEPNQDLDIVHCVCCGRNIRNKRSYKLPEGSLLQHIAERIHPRQVLPGHRLCNPCYHVGRRRMQQIQEARNDCILPNYRRSPESSASCFVRNCGNSKLVNVPCSLQKKLLKEKKFLTARRAVVCQEHMGLKDWGILNNLYYSNKFTSTQIEYMLELCNESQGIDLDFENFETLDDSKCKYWTGFSKENFETILNESPSLYERFPRFVKTALAMYLIQSRTGDSNGRLGLLFNRSECFISKTCAAVRTCLTQDFVP